MTFSIIHALGGIKINEKTVLAQRIAQGAGGHLSVLFFSLLLLKLGASKHYVFHNSRAWRLQKQYVFHSYRAYVFHSSRAWRFQQHNVFHSSRAWRFKNNTFSIVPAPGGSETLRFP
jgi:hypothetical protein